MLDLGRLNPEQRDAVTAGEGPVLVVAGPGSGKTAVIAARVAYLIDEGIATPDQILAVTFTNKAGRELKRRVRAALGEQAGQVWAGTFHAFALGMLRRWGGYFGFDPDHLSIYADEEDRRSALNQALADLGLEPKQEPRQDYLDFIGRCKERLLGPDEVKGPDERAVAVYAAYQEVLHRRNAVDFDDFLLYGVRLLQEHEDVPPWIWETYMYLLVDEFQDLNHPQYMLLSLIAGERRNLFVVGDPAQNLYSWRGSDIRYLLEFQRTYPEARVIALEQNYRSTQAILDVANALSVALSYGKRNLWTANSPGFPVIMRAAEDSEAEAAFVTAEVIRLLNEGAIAAPGDCAVLYRTNAQARELELACVQAGIPYSVRGNSDFLARKEIRDVLAYLHLVHNPQDVGALTRVVNTPPRGLASLERRLRNGEELTVRTLRDRFPCDIRATRGQDALRHLLDTLEALAAMAQAGPDQLIASVLEATGYRPWLERQRDGPKRIENLSAFLDLAQRSDAENLSDFLDELSLATDLETGSSADGLVLSTIHAAKGLEWPVVLVTGLEEGLLPHTRSMDDEVEGGALEEELRLLYVAITRAIDRLYLTYARRRNTNGRPVFSVPSRFLGQIPGRLVKRGAA